MKRLSALFWSCDRDTEGDHHSGQRGVDAGVVHENPYGDADCEIDQERGDLQTVQHQHERDTSGGGEIDEREIGGVEQRDDDDGTEIVDDGERGEEDLQRCRRACSDQRQDAGRKDDVGRGGDGPAMRQRRIAAVKCEEDQRGVTMPLLRSLVEASDAITAPLAKVC